MKQALLLLALGLLLGGAPRGAGAHTCSASPSALSFGNVSPIALNAVAATGSVTVQCTWPMLTLTPSVQVCLNLGGTRPRYLASGIGQVRYDLYRDAAHSLAWGSTALGTTPISLTLDKPLNGTRASATVNFYGLIAANPPTVPTTGNVRTVYAQTLSQTSLNYGFFLMLAPGCRQ
ncbi:spore coat U domain-containing protein [Paraburkholderia sp. MMS20-SJTR3]|uniref:Spore coat U domain-containing protein n=1 Tax=Paraburkholderia sejongensis TaxID=2886946 RepID=A0ABS8K281_9BURK|nr:spore coat protein U domain-containing protein [Paraburkholderia sp. MMS20-SJTR3]MCC8396250.1 spore coat U domain-containing protein [Paraburkholderia sp. MMS20-SJTR3]